MKKEYNIRVAANCIRCGRCVKVCPSKIFVRDEAGGTVSLREHPDCDA